MAKRISAFSWNALTKSKCKISCMALCEPQPEHFNPVKWYNGHLGKNDHSRGLSFQ